MNYKTTFEGILETLDNQDIPYQKSFADILGNHWLGELTPETVKVVWEFHRLNNTEIYEFKRFEEDSTGAGMEEEKLMKEFFGIPPKALASLKRGVSVHGIGENSAYAKLSKQCEEFRSTDGITVLTKRKEDDKYLYAIFNMYDYTNKSNGYIQPVIKLSYNEALKKNLPVDRIGTNGTYTSYKFSLHNIDNEWYDKTKRYVANIFSGYIKNNKYNLTFRLFKSGVQVDEDNIKAKRIPYDTVPSYNEPAFRGALDYEGKKFPYDLGRRPMNKSVEFQEFEKMYPGEQALKGKDLVEPIAKNMALLIVDKDTGYIYSINKIPVAEKNLHRLIMQVYVTLDDIATDTNKARAYFKKINGKAVGVAETHKVVLATARSHYENVDVHEDELREQLVKILHGEQKFHPLFYTELCEALDIPEGDYKWAKENIATNTPTLHKKLDIYIKERGHIIELKKTTPDGDKDFNQIVCYSTLMSNVKRVTTLAVSNESAEYPKSFTDKFSSDIISKFTTDLNTLDTTKHIKWSLLDLRRSGLHKLIK